MIPWSRVYAEQSRHADIERDVKRLQLAEQVEQKERRAVRRIPVHWAVVSSVLALLTYIHSHLAQG